MATSNDVLKLRQETGAGVMDCKKALGEANGDFDKAKEFLKARGVEIASKKSSRSVNQGIIECYVHSSKVGVILELACESDFVARNEEFKKLAHEITMQVASMAPADVDELLNQDYIREPGKKISDLLQEAVAKIGENIQIRRFVRYSLGEEL